MHGSASFSPPADGHAERFVTAPDGKRLFVRDYGQRTWDAMPVVCLPGLARTSADFDVLARAFATAEPPRRVIAVDYRGRGRSDYDHPKNYTLAVELADVIAVLTALAVPPALFVGTSRGGLLTMLLAGARPTMLRGAVLNDIGPVIDGKGLARIKSYVGKLPPPKSHEDGAEILRRIFAGQFPKLGPADWLAYARRTWEEHGGRFRLTYDPKLARTLDSVDLEQPVPAVWPAFEALRGLPLLVIRGALSDLLSPETVAAMAGRHPGMETLEVPDQGHAPLLVEPDVIGRIAAFADACDRPRA